MQGTFVSHILHYTIKNTSFPPEAYYSLDFSFSVFPQFCHEYWYYIYHYNSNFALANKRYCKNICYFNYYGISCTSRILCKGRMLPSALGEVFSILVPLRATSKWERSLKKDARSTALNTA